MKKKNIIKNTFLGSMAVILLASCDLNMVPTDAIV